MILRDAEASDAAGVAAIWNAAIRDSVATFTTAEKTNADLVARFASAPCFLVAVLDDRVAGFALYDQFRGGPGYAHSMELTIYTDPAHTGHGIGRALMDALEARARAGDVHSLWAGIGSENTGSIAFHNRLGYRHIATLPEVGRKFGRWMDLVLMAKYLT